MQRVAFSLAPASAPAPAELLLLRLASGGLAGDGDGALPLLRRVTDVVRVCVALASVVRALTARAIPAAGAVGIRAAPTGSARRAKGR